MSIISMIWPSPTVFLKLDYANSDDHISSYTEVVCFISSADLFYFEFITSILPVVFTESW